MALEVRERFAELVAHERFALSLWILGSHENSLSWEG